MKTTFLSLHVQKYERLFKRVDHAFGNYYMSLFCGGRFHGRCVWRNERQRYLAGVYATSMCKNIKILNQNVSISDLSMLFPA